MADDITNLKKDIDKASGFFNSIDKLRRSWDALTNIKPNIPKIEPLISPHVAREQNSWERHREMIKAINTMNETQRENVQEQKKTSIISIVIVNLTIIATFFTLLILLHEFGII